MVVPQKFRNAGQVCVSPTRSYVQEGIYQRFIEGFAARTAQVTTGHGLDAETKMGPLANVRRPQAIAALVEDAEAKGARVMAGGRRGNAGFFFQPTLLADVPDSADIMNNEPFGPVAVAAPFSTLDDAIAKANRCCPMAWPPLPLPRTCARPTCWATGSKAAWSGSTPSRSVLPMPRSAGSRISGFGSEGGLEGLDSYLVTKAIHTAFERGWIRPAAAPAPDRGRAGGPGGPAGRNCP